MSTLKRTARPRPGATQRARKPRGAYHHGDLRRALIEAALALLKDHDPRQLSLRELARRAGVSTAAPYRHFSSKADVLAAVAEEGFRGLAAAMRAQIAAAPADPLARFREAGVGYVLFAHAHPAHYRVMFGPELVEKSAHPDLAGAALDAFDVLMQAIGNCVRAGALPAGDTQRVALAAWAGVHGLASLISAGQLEVLQFHTRRIEDLARDVATALLGGVTGGSDGR